MLAEEYHDAMRRPLRMGLLFIVAYLLAWLVCWADRITKREDLLSKILSLNAR